MEIHTPVMQARAGEPDPTGIADVWFKTNETSGVMVDSISGATYNPGNQVYSATHLGIEGNDSSRTELTGGTLPNLGDGPFLFVFAGVITNQNFRVAFGQNATNGAGNLSVSNFGSLHLIVEDHSSNQVAALAAGQAVLSADDEVIVTIKHKGTGVTGTVVTVTKRDGTAVTNGTATEVDTINHGDVDLSLQNKLKTSGIILQGIGIFTYDTEPDDIDEAINWWRSTLHSYRTPYPNAADW